MQTHTHTHAPAKLCVMHSEQAVEMSQWRRHDGLLSRSIKSRGTANEQVLFLCHPMNHAVITCNVTHMRKHAQPHKAKRNYNTVSLPFRAKDILQVVAVTRADPRAVCSHANRDTCVSCCKHIQYIQRACTHERSRAPSVHVQFLIRFTVAK